MKLMSIKRDKIDGRGRGILITAGYTTSSSILLTPPSDILSKTSLTIDQINALKLQIATAVSNEGEGTITELVKEGESDCITTGDEVLDGLLGGGLRVDQGITEVCGEASAGKTTLSLLLSLTVQLPFAYGGQNGSCIYLTTEYSFPSTRLLQLADGLLSRLPSSLSDGKTTKDFTDNVHLARVEDVEGMEHTLEFLIPQLIKSIEQRKMKAPKLLIVDSIAAPFRIAHDNNFIKRSKDLSSISDRLKFLSHTYSLAILVINQVSSVFSPSQSSPSPSYPRTAHIALGLPQELYSSIQTPFISGQSPSHPFIASLGHNWSNCINTRIMLSKKAGGEEGRRAMRIVFAPWGRRGTVEWEIREEGVRGVGEIEWEEEWKGLESGENGDMEEEDGEDMLWKAVGGVDGEGEE